MIPALIETAPVWVLTSCCGLTAVSNFAWMARTKDGWRWREGLWTAPLVFSSATVAALTWLGTLQPAPGVFLAALLAAPVTVMEARAWLDQAKGHGKLKAARIVLANLLGRLKLGVLYAFDDLRAILGLVRSRKALPVQTPAAGIPPEAAAAIRAVPALTENGDLGSIPAPAEVAADLTAAGVMIPPPWVALAQYTAEFEPEDEAALLGSMAEEAAGILTWAEAKMTCAENLINGPKLHPIYVAGQMELAEAAAELAALAALANRAYYTAYGDIHDWRDINGNQLPENARQWFGEDTEPPAGDPGENTDEGGAAA